MSNVGDVTTQNQLDSLSSFVRIRLRSTDHQRSTNAFTSSTSAMDADDRLDRAERRGQTETAVSDHAGQ